MSMLSMRTATYIPGTNIGEEWASSWPLFLLFSLPLSCKFATFFADNSCRILCWLQTGNLLKGETTCERFAKTNYKVLHQYHKEQLSLELSLELDIKRRFSVMTIDDQTNQNDACCGNVTGMCCD